MGCIHNVVWCDPVRFTIHVIQQTNLISCSNSGPRKIRTWFCDDCVRFHFETRYGSHDIDATDTSC